MDVVNLPRGIRFEIQEFFFPVQALKLVMNLCPPPPPEGVSQPMACTVAGCSFETAFGGPMGCVLHTAATREPEAVRCLFDSSEFRK